MNYNKGNRFYGVATTEKGTNVMVNNLSDEWVLANNEARSHCKQNNLVFGGVKQFAFKSDSGTVLTKNAKKRKVLRGKKGWKESSKLFFG